MASKSCSVTLRAAEETDREKVYLWLCASDVTPSMMGPPLYPDHPIPTWEEFCDDYSVSFFTASGEGRGRVYIIMDHDEEVGTVGYDLLNMENKTVVLDVWMKEEKYCGYGYGSMALQMLSDKLHKTYGVTQCMIAPSQRNVRAIKAYEKAGFKGIKMINKKEQKMLFGLSECDDTFLMIKEM